MQQAEGYNEFRQRGTLDFPLEFHHLDLLHPRYQMPHHWHYECEMIRVLQGRFTVSLDQTVYTVGTGEIIFVSSGTVHGGVPENCTYECIVFDMNLLIKKEVAFLSDLQRIADRDILVQPFFPVDDRQLQELVWQLFDVQQQRGAGYQLTTVGALYQFFGLVLQNKYYSVRSSGERREHKRTAQLKRVLSQIEASYGEALTLEQLSREAGMSPKYFCQFFQEMTRRTPIDYLNYYRIEQAADQLLRSDATITEIAYRCGFNDLSYFIRIFKKYKGKTPGQYVKQLHRSEKASGDA